MTRCGACPQWLLNGGGGNKTTPIKAAGHHTATHIAEISSAALLDCMLQCNISIDARL
ncbi:hypothetical protein [Mesorhizobium sp. CN2-181]|uniref:hypothetical protein n=1 Tax=Mesorhizobium yinganensis TaxID=3157707 RepID=UPI0032B77AE5